MNSSAHVKSIEGLAELKNGIAAFGEVAQSSVSQVTPEVARVQQWLAEREHYWQQQVRLAQEMVRQASAALRACESSRHYDPKTGREQVPDCSAEKAALARAHARLRQAEEELQKVQRYRQMIEQSFAAFTREATRLTNQSLPAMIQYLGKVIARLEAYLAGAPQGDADAGAVLAANENSARLEPSNYAGNALHQREFSAQVDHAVATLSQVAAINPAIWNALSLPERVRVLTNIEKTMAAIQNRPAVPIKTSKYLDNRNAGYYDLNKKEIILNENRLASNGDDVFEHVGTIVHEGRHAYQHYAIQNPGIMPDPKMVAAWKNNMPPPASNYFSPKPRYDSKGRESYDPDDMKKYAEQSVEADAFAYENAIIDAIQSSSIN